MVVAITLGTLWSVPSVVAANELRSSADAMQENHAGHLDALESARSDQEAADRKLIDGVRAADRAWASFDASIANIGMGFTAEIIYRLWDRWEAAGDSNDHPEYQTYRSAAAAVVAAKAGAEDAADDVLSAEVVAKASAGALATNAQKLPDAEGDMVLRLSVAGAIAVLAILGAIAVSVVHRRNSDLPGNEPSQDAATQAQTPADQAAG